MLFQVAARDDELYGQGKTDLGVLAPPFRPAPREWLATYYSPEPLEIEFQDSSGQLWTRNEQGFLAPGSTMTPDEQRSWWHRSFVHWGVR
jgi:hypothetical protein